MEKKYISIDQLWKCETCFYMGGDGKCRSDCDTVESYRPAYSKFEFADADPVVHGYWIETVREWGFSHFHYVDFTCSTCGSREVDKRNYCPECGAKMDGGKPRE